MKLTGAFINHWLQMRTPLQRMYTLTGAILICLIFWFFIWEENYQSAQDSLIQQTQTLQKQMEAFNQHTESLQKLLNNPNLMQKRIALKKEMEAVNKLLNAVSTRLFSSSDMIKALKNMLVKEPDLVLLRLSNTGNFLLAPGSLADADKSKNNPDAMKLYRHDFVLEFQGAYFPALNYLTKLEAMPWQFYWDSVSYETGLYPNAKITLKLHIVSAQEGLTNV